MDELNYVKNVWEPLDYTNLLKRFEETVLFEMILNIILVKLGIRRATLIELNNLDHLDNKNKYKNILDIIVDKLEMIKTTNISYRYFVTNDIIDPPQTDKDIGKLLGFKCFDHKYFLENVSRISYSIIEQITGKQIYTEVCEKDKISNLKQMNRIQNKKVKLWNKKINGIIPYRFFLNVSEFIPKYVLLNNYRDKTFVRKHIEKYKNLIFNDFFDTSQFKEASVILKHFDIFVFIMDNLDEIDKLYNIPSNKYPSKGFDRLLVNLKQFEDNLLKTKDKAVMELLLNQLISTKTFSQYGKKNKSKNTSKKSKNTSKKSKNTSKKSKNISKKSKNISKKSKNTSKKSKKKK